MKFDIMTLFCDLVDTVLCESIIGRAREAGIIEVRTHNIRAYSKDKHHRVDDTPYGGGKGMLMAAPPIYDCFCDIEKEENRRVIYMSPKGKVFNQKKAKELSRYDQLIFLCGHYEGVDERVLNQIVDEEISIGDYVLTGGEIPACIVIDAVSRLIDGVLSDSECYENESIACGMLEYPQYTRPYDFMGEVVPQVLLDGNHKEIEKWRFEAALEETRKKRKDLL